jgi:hypothetical protein
MNRLILISFFILTIRCYTQQSADCPLCVPIALHFAFVDSTQTKVLMNKVVVVNDKNDSAVLWDTTHRCSALFFSDKNYMLEGTVGRYKIIYTDSIFGTASIDNVIVQQNMEYQQCGVLPLTQHIKVLVKRQTSLVKSHSVISPIIIEQFEKGSCGSNWN